MHLEKPSLSTGGDLKTRVENLERYLYRLVWELEGALEALEKKEEILKRKECFYGKNL